VLSLYEIDSIKPRYHRGSGAYKEPQFLDSRILNVGSPGVNTTPQDNFQLAGRNNEVK
jgi:hypothetical protein